LGGESRLRSFRKPPVRYRRKKRASRHGLREKRGGRASWCWEAGRRGGALIRFGKEQGKGIEEERPRGWSLKGLITGASIPRRGGEAKRLEIRRGRGVCDQKKNSVRE